MRADARYFEALWEQYLEAPATLSSDWRNAFDFIQCFYEPPATARVGPSVDGAPASDRAVEYLRRFGHLHANLDPLGLTSIPPFPDFVRRSETDGGLRDACAGQIAVETGHLDSPEMGDWIAAAFDALQGQAAPPDPTVYEQLIAAETFDRFLATKYPAKKRFGSEGADAVIPLLHAVKRAAAASAIDELVIGSMHRGRLSIMANVLDMDLPWLLSLIKGAHPFPGRPGLAGDVPYHLGQVGEYEGMRCTLLPNPSHLEAVNPVVVGYTRARRTQGAGRAMAVILHTDASVVGQGVNAELLQMSGLAGFEVGGVVHIVINNQIGFTTEPHEARTSRYCSGPWRAVDSLLVHVNGDAVDAVVAAGKLAVDFRGRFGRDAVIDLVCYRANGHNEIDEPRFTQPLYYGAADAKLGPAKLYEQRMIGAGLLSEVEASDRREAIYRKLDQSLTAGSPGPSTPSKAPPRARRTWSKADLSQVISALSLTPEGRSNTKMARLMARRVDEIEGGVSWPLAEAMAFACLLREGISVRLSGQDVERGSFSQRHLAAVDPASGDRRHVLNDFRNGEARFEVVNSPLSEYAVLGFEYGYSLAAPNTLCIWEAQFGDFANGAQIVIDQFISSGAEKWTQTSGLTVLLPHGLEGQGPEHSSARIERLLQLCARGNIAVAQPTTPANYFHLLMEQAARTDRPLFIVTPKVLLRHPQARSPLEDFTSEGRFEPVVLTGGSASAARVVVCAGKIAYEVEQLRDKYEADVDVLRLESLYPFPSERLLAKLAALSVKEMVWLQEEPENFGAGAWLAPKLASVAQAAGIRSAPMIARPESASPAGSFHMAHDSDQFALVRRALELGDDDAK